MNRKIKIIALLLAVAMLAALAACNNSDEDEEPEDSDPIDVADFLLGFPEGVPEEYNNLGSRIPYSASNGLNELGHWNDARALNYVDFGDFDWQNIEFPHFLTEITDMMVEERIYAILSEYPMDSVENTDREVEDGDQVNIDFVGSVGGVEFEGGSTDGAGMDVEAGSDQFIDDFLSQIIGAMPGDEVNVRVSFPDEYPMNPDLAGKPALFVTTINFIHDPEDEDVYVERNFKDNYGWTTMEEYREGVREMIFRERHESFMTELFDEHITVEIPERVRQVAVENSIRFHQNSAYEMDFDTFEDYLRNALQVESGVREFVERSLPRTEERIRNQLIIQAMAETLDLQVSNDDIRAFFDESGGLDTDIDETIAARGIEFLKLETLGWKVRSFLIESGTYLDPPADD
jgi:trigger factor